MTEPLDTEPGAVATGLITPEQIVAAARSYIGTPFKHQSQDPAFGLDCRGLILAVGYQTSYQFSGSQWANDYQVHPDPASQAYARKAGELLEALETEFERVWGSSPTVREGGVYTQAYALAHARATAPSTIVHIQFAREPLPTHCGIIAANQHEPTIIHALGRDHGGAVIEEPLRRWLDSVVGAFAWKGVS